MYNSMKDGVSCLSVVDGGNATVHPAFKDCDPTSSSSICFVSGASSYSGIGSQGDLLIAAQSKSAAIHVYQWHKPQSHVLCRMQEMITALQCDSGGTYLIGGTKKGWLYLWEIGTGKLLKFWQGHFKPVKVISFAYQDNFFVSSSEDGITKVWDISDVLGGAGSISATGLGRSHIEAFRAFTHHVQPITGMVTRDTGLSSKILSCSLDRTLVVQSLFSSKQVHRIMFSEPLESIACNATCDLVFLGASSGRIFMESLSASALLKMRGDGGEDGEKSVFLGHERAVTSLALTKNGKLLLSGSEDGSVRIWDVGTRQCLKVIQSARGAPVRALMAVESTDMDLNAPQKPSLVPVGHIRKIADTDAAAESLAPALIGPAKRRRS